MRKDWFTCKKCHKKLLLFNDIANSTGIFIKCKKCGYENEVLIVGQTYRWRVKY